MCRNSTTRMDELKKLISEKQVNVNLANSEDNNFTGLQIADQIGNLETVKFLIQSGADINCKENKDWTALQIAAQNGHLETVKFLIQSGTDINSKTNFNENALEIAIRKGHVEVVNLLRNTIHKGK